MLSHLFYESVMTCDIFCPYFVGLSVMKNEIRVHNWFDCLPVEVKSAVLECMPTRRLAPGEILFSIGEVAEALYLVVQGEIEVSTVSSDGKELILYINYPGDCFGETGLVTGTVRFHTASARHASVVSVLSVEKFERLRVKHPEINRALLLTQSKRVEILATRLGAYASRNLRQVIIQRLAFLAENARRQECGGCLIQTGLSQKEYGKLFGASRQSVNKELNLLQDQQLIELRRNGIFIRCLQDLSRAALVDTG